ncbi:ATP-dependent RNA helicase DBP9 [Polyplosphaeria fusca]|uniref:RNA helicase n=1 Tax=Polyplosphaeria fusca TaxID=682080 RepID=A0A9P4UUM9_9PLEO|nr:ATP-dependent RNA helicase DBP9 [Polyplosphaeria fusca]
MPSTKRKLNDDDVPTPVNESSAEATFDSFGLEPRLLRGIRDQKFAGPTLVQTKTIPLALEGRDIVARSGTGTGKTLAYLAPIINSAIRRQGKHTSSLILVPTRELATQIQRVALSLAAHCAQDVRVQNISGKEGLDVQRAMLADLPDIVISTPGRASVNINNGALSLKDLVHLVVDEADLTLGYGHLEDLQNISKSLPKGVQIFLMSATLNTEIDTLQGIFCQNPVRLELDDLEKNAQLVKQYMIPCDADEKFLLAMAMFLLKLIKGKTIIFVGDVDRSYRVKLFLEQFGIKSCVLNSELPLQTRLHVVQQFNRGIYDILIASDEMEVLGAKNTDSDKPVKKKSKKYSNDSGVSRGIDFLNVSCVLNFDLPSSYKSYFHRIGRTARAGKSGTAISFFVPKEKYKKHKPTAFEGSENDEEVLRKINKHQKDGQHTEDFAFDMKKLDPFRYRFADALRAVTRIAVREARIRELRQELLKSEKLSRYFEENPEALSSIKHDHNLTHAARIQSHLKHVPDYLLPGGKLPAGDIGFVGLEKDKRDTGKKFKRKGKKVFRKGKVDPLKTFNAQGRGKK